MSGQAEGLDRIAIDWVVKERMDGAVTPNALNPDGGQKFRMAPVDEPAVTPVRVPRMAKEPW